MQQDAIADVADVNDLPFDAGFSQAGHMDASWPPHLPPPTDYGPTVAMGELQVADDARMGPSSAFVPPDWTYPVAHAMARFDTPMMPNDPMDGSDGMLGTWPVTSTASSHLEHGGMDFEMSPAAQSDRAAHSHSTPSSASQTSSAARLARSYVDGVGTRAPFKGLALPKSAHTRQALLAETDLGERIAEKLVQTYQGREESDRGATVLVTAESYRILTAHVGGGGGGASSSNFPTQDQASFFCSLYFSRFHPIYPFLRRESFLAESTLHPSLALAVVAMGCRFASSGLRRQYADALDSLLEARATSDLCDIASKRGGNVPSEEYRSAVVMALRSALLNMLLMLHSSDESTVRRVRLGRHLLFEVSSDIQSHATTHTLAELDSRAGRSERQDYISSWLLHQAEIRVVAMTLVSERYMQEMPFSCSVRLTWCSCSFSTACWSTSGVSDEGRT